MNWSNLLLGHEGRINRKTFLIGLAPVVGLMVLLYVYLRFLGGLLPGWLHILFILLLAVEALFFLTNISIKRLRDIGRQTVFLVIFYSPFFVAALFLLQQKFMPVGKESQPPLALAYTTAITLALVGFLWILTELVFRRSKEQQGSDLKDD